MTRQRPHHHGRRNRHFRSGDRWTPAETEYLLQQRSGPHGGTPYENIGAALGRTMLACRLHCHHERQRRKLRARLAAAAAAAVDNDPNNPIAPSSSNPPPSPPASTPTRRSRRARPGARRSRSNIVEDRPLLRPIVPQARPPNRIPSIAEQQLPLPSSAPFQQMYGPVVQRSSSMPIIPHGDFVHPFAQQAYESPQQPPPPPPLRRDTVAEYYYPPHATTSEHHSTTWTTTYQPPSPAQNHISYVYQQPVSHVRDEQYPPPMAGPGPATAAAWANRHASMPAYFSQLSLQPSPTTPTGPAPAPAPASAPSRRHRYAQPALQALPTQPVQPVQPVHQTPPVQQAPPAQPTPAAHPPQQVPPPVVYGYNTFFVGRNERGGQWYQQRTGMPPVPGPAAGQATSQQATPAETNSEGKQPVDESRGRRGTLDHLLNPQQ